MLNKLKGYLPGKKVKEAVHEEVKQQITTAQDMMNTSDWVYEGVYNFKLMAAHYYTSRVETAEGDRYNIHCMYSTSKLGTPVIIFLRYVSELLSKVFNLMQQGLGEDIFDKVIEESKSQLRARKHRETIEKAVTLGGMYRSVVECKAAILQDYNDKKVTIKEVN